MRTPDFTLSESFLGVSLRANTSRAREWLIREHADTTLIFTAEEVKALRRIVRDAILKSMTVENRTDTALGEDDGA